MENGCLDTYFGLAAAALMFSAASSGCTPVAPGVLSPTGFNQPDYGYRIEYAAPTARSFLGSDWRVDNFAEDETGAWKAKDGENYVAVREIDENDDGKISNSEMHKEPIYDLRLTNVRDDGVIWVKAHPVAHQNANRDLDVELNSYAESLSGTGAYYQGSVFSVEHVKSRQFTTFVVGQENRKVAGLDGIVATVEVAETARVQLDPAYRTAKIRVFLAKISYLRKLSPLLDADGNPKWPSVWPQVKCSAEGTDTCEQRTGILVVGYVNAASRFEQHLPEYDTFLSKISRTSLPQRPASEVPSRSSGD
jgi:hypothetical protein